MTITEVLKALDANAGSKSELRGVLLNFSIAILLSAIGVILFKFLWLKQDRYKLPDLESGLFDSKHDQPVNSFMQYAKSVFKLIRTKNVQPFIKRYGFEYYFYLRFHSTLALNFFVGFFVICIIVSIYSISSDNEPGFTWKRIIGIYYEGSKAYPVLNTIIMVSVSLIITFNLRRMTVLFQTALNDRVDEVQSQASVEEEPIDDFSLIMNTALLYGCSPYDEEQKVLIPYLKRLIKEHRIDAVIQSHYSPPHHVELARILSEIDNQKLFYYHHPMYLSVLKLFKPKVYKTEELFLKHIEELESQRDELISKTKKVSGYTFILFGSVAETARFKKLMKRNSQTLKTDLLKFTKKSKREDEDDEAMQFLELKDQELNIDYENVSFNAKIFSTPENIVWDNVHIKDLTQSLKKIILNALVIIMFVFMTTPSAGIQLFLHNSWSSSFFKDFLHSTNPGIFAKFLRDYVTVVLTIVFNILFRFLIAVIARNNRFTKYSRFHQFILNYTYYYLLLNMVLIPALALSFGNSIFEFINSRNFQFGRIINNFYLMDYGAFFINIVLQSGSFIVLIDLNRFTELFDGLFSVEVAHRIRQGFNTDRFKCKEINAFRVGYNYAESSVIGVMVLFIGLYSPLLYVGGAMFFSFKFLAHSPLLMSVFEKDAEDFGTLLRNAVAKVYSGVIMGHFFLFVVCALTRHMWLSAINLGVLALAVLMAFKLTKLPNLKQVVSIESVSKHRKVFRPVDKKRWKEMFEHPVDRKIEQIRAQQK